MDAERVLSLERVSKKVVMMIDSDCAGGLSQVNCVAISHFERFNLPRLNL